MTDLLPVLGALTLGGSAAILLFAFLTRASRARYGARWRCWIWVVLCLRLAVPVSFLPGGGEESGAPIRISTPSDTVLYRYQPPRQTGDGPSGAQEAQGGTAPSPAVSSAAGAQTEEPLLSQLKREFSISLSQVILLVWLAGVIAIAAWAAVSHLRFLRWQRRWRRAVEEPETIRLYNQLGDELGFARRPRLRICAGLRAPMLAGLFYPVILLPEDAPAGEELRFALLHELTHYRRRDIWLKSLALLVNIIHWFNPCMWYMVRLVGRDTELACDEAALRRLPPEDHAAYGRTILAAVERLKGDAGKETP